MGDKLEEIENKLAKNLEESLSNQDYINADVILNCWEAHIKYHGSKNIERFCELKNKYLKAVGAII